MDKKKILVVEDEKAISDILVFNLQREGYDTLAAYDGAEGLRCALEEAPDLILLDVMLPEMDGFEVCRRVRAEKGDCLHDFVGPLGKASELEGLKKVAVVGGGLGCAIAYPQAKKLHEMGAEVDLIAGFRNKDIIILEDEMKNACTNLHIVTDDGSNGRKALVTQVLKELIDAGNQYDAVIAIGPMIMMKFVCETTRPYGIKTIVSMNTIMVDGTGMCGGCRLTVGGETKFACVDGPDFDGHLVDFDSAMRRGAMYKAQERAAVERREEHCNLFKKEVK